MNGVIDWVDGWMEILEKHDKAKNKVYQSIHDYTSNQNYIWYPGNF